MTHEDEYDGDYDIADKRLKKKHPLDVLKEEYKEVKKRQPQVNAKGEYKEYKRELKEIEADVRQSRHRSDEDKRDKDKEPAAFFTTLLMQIETAKKKGIQKLDLSGGSDENYKLTDLPPSLFKLGKLRSLDLSNNALTALPDTLSALSQLESIDLSYNRLTSFPKVLNRLPSLRSINLAGNGLAGTTDTLHGLARLVYLNLSANGFTTLPESVAKLSHLKSLILSRNILKTLPGAILNLTRLETLDLSLNTIEEVPQEIGLLSQLISWDLSYNSLTSLPESLGELRQLRQLDLHNNKLVSLPERLGKLEKLQRLDLSYNQLTDLPASLAELDCFDRILYQNNTFNLELDAAQREGRAAVRQYLRSKAEEQITLNEAKLIIVGEGEVGKSCLLDALRGDPWEEGRPTTHGIEIKPVVVTDIGSRRKILLNGWDFGGQRVYRPTHQLFFSAPAVYLVVWKPREGPQQGFVKEWIQLVKRREPTAKILVVATHGGPQQRQPDIDRQELWDQFNKETVIDFFHVESKPDENRERRGIKELKRSIAHVASTLPEVGRSVPKRWQEVRSALTKTEVPYLPLEQVLKLCWNHQMGSEEARLFVIIEHRLGHLIHYQHDPMLRDIVILKPNWLATAISFVLDDEITRKAHGLVRFSRLSQLWNDPTRELEFRYPVDIHPIFLRLMERFDLSYRVADPSSKESADPQSLIAQLVPDITPEKDLENAWQSKLTPGDLEQTQICRIVDERGQSATAEGLFYQLIVRLHKYSLGRANYSKSVHWQRGLVLDYEYNGRALLRNVGNDVHITVRAPYPERFLTMLTEEVKYLVESFWEGLRCNVMVPCLNINACHGLFEVRKLIENKRRGRAEQPCPICNEWQDIDQLLRNAPAAQPDATALIFTEFAEVKAELSKARQQISYQGEKIMGRFDRLDERTRRTLSRVDKTYVDLLHLLTDEAKEGPRLFSLVPVNRSNFNPREWTRSKFRLTLWCEHSRQPLNSPELNGPESTKGIYEFEFEREWFRKVAPYLKFVMGTLSLVLPVTASGIKLKLDDSAYEAIEEQLAFGKSVIDAALGEGKSIDEFIGVPESVSLEYDGIINAHGAILRELHALLKSRDAGFGGLVRVMNKRQEFLWVHSKFEKEY